MGRIDNFFLKVYTAFENISEREKQACSLGYHFVYGLLMIIIALTEENKEIAGHISTALTFILIIWVLFLFYDTEELKNSNDSKKISFFAILLFKLFTPVLIYFLFKEEKMLEKLVQNSIYFIIVSLNMIAIAIASHKEKNIFDFDFKKTYLLIPIFSLNILIILFGTRDPSIEPNEWYIYLFALLFFMAINLSAINRIKKIELLYLAQQRAGIPKIKTAEVSFKNSNNGWTVSATVDSFSLKSVTFNLGRDSFDKAYNEAFKWIQANK